MKNRVMLIAVLCAVALCPKPAQAYPITIYIEAVVDTVEDNGSGNGYLDGQVQIGDTITGYYTYESTTLDTNPSSKVGDYWHDTSPYGMFLSVGGFNFQTDPANIISKFVIEMVNDYPSGDGYLARSYVNLSLSNGTVVDVIEWQLNDYSGLAISDDSLPATPPVLADWPDFNHFRLEGDRTFLIDAHVISAIPEPATLLLVGLGAFFLRKFK